MKPLARQPRDLILLLCFASLTHLGLWLYGQHLPAIRTTNDSNEYIRTAENLLNKGTVYCGRLDRKIEPAHFSKRPPLYPVFIAALHPISKDPGLIAIAQILLNLLGAYLMWEILCYLNVSRSLRILVIAFYLFYPAQLIYTHLVMAEVLLQLLLLSSFYFLVRFHETKKSHHLAFCNLILGFSALAKPIMVYFWLPNLLYQAWLLWPLRRQKLIFLSLIPLLFVTLWSYRNYVRTGYFHFSSIKTSNILHVNIPGMVRRVEGTERARIVRRDLQRKIDSAESFAEASRTAERAFFETMLAHWRSLAQAYARGTLFFFLDPGRFDLYEFLNWPHNVRSFHFLTGGIGEVTRKLGDLPPFVLPYLLLVGSVNLLLLAGFIYSALIRRYPLELKFFVLILMLYTLLIVAPTGLSRFRLSVMPFLLLALPALLERLLKILTTRKIRSSGSASSR